ncbi:uncharacterized protein LOC113212013 isoform X1 [Frankliniella occidentalis]|uniref:poly(ADP-ribose) glycohydrolase n=1 Tax=Frankliniella occidentalis TaxID=133901 RepID=A0A9C6WMT3_FRAOC|nr:uncharacterized protein LOC113212013 isoform X1 [Frankliniella occidentalis]
MALVMLPCDVPWWPTLVRHLQQIAEAKDPAEFVEGMLKIHNMCNVGLDPDEPERPDQTVFDGLRKYLEKELSAAERSHFLRQTAPAMVRRALALKDLKPPSGLHFSLQQQGDRVEYDRPFIASVLAHAFFSSYPKRTPKTHPTLQDCNFSLFFRNLDQKCQKAKLRSIWRYFDEMELDTAPTDKIIISREVMTGREWLTIEDWLECGLPLCPLAVRHEGRLERAEPSALRVCFANSRLGGAALEDGSSQEAVQFTTCPELVAVLLRVEALEDNEALIVENLLQVARIADPRQRATFEPVSGSVLLSVCCVDAENYRRLPLSQFEEDNVLRELNKALLGFRQHRWVAPPQPPEAAPTREHHQRRLSPIGESFSSTQSDAKEPHHPDGTPARGRAPPRGRSISPSGRPRPQGPGRPPRQPARRPKGGGGGPPPTTPGPAGAAARRGRFIVLGSSGECLPVSRRKIMTGGLTQRRGPGGALAPGAAAGAAVQPRGRAASRPPGDDSSGSDEFHSAHSSLEGSDDDQDGGARRYSAEMDSPQRRSAFAERLREALRREAQSSSESDESSYAVGITVAGTGLADEDIRLRRGGSRGFMLDDSRSVESYTEAPSDALALALTLAAQSGPPERRPLAQGGGAQMRRSSSSKYSFDTELSSDLEDAYEQFANLVEDQRSSSGSSEMEGRVDGRDVAVAQFASRLLKRTLSDSFAGVQLGDEHEPQPRKPTLLAGGSFGATDGGKQRHLKLAHIARSMSLELAKHKHRLASQLVSQLEAALSGEAASRGGMRAVATGNWGCGSERAGDPQLKLIIQWLAASVAGAPCLVYYTCGHHKLLKLDTVCRIVLDRHWTVGELTDAALGFAQTCLDSPSPPHTGQALFDALLGVER